MESFVTSDGVAEFGNGKMQETQAYLLSENERKVRAGTWMLKYKSKM